MEPGLFISGPLDEISLNYPASLRVFTCLLYILFFLTDVFIELKGQLQKEKEGRRQRDREWREGEEDRGKEREEEGQAKKGRGRGKESKGRGDEGREEAEREEGKGEGGKELGRRDTHIPSECLCSSHSATKNASFWLVQDWEAATVDSSSFLMP